MFLSLEHFYFCHCLAQASLRVVFAADALKTARASDFEFLTEKKRFSVKH
jgi:hypothetical protein